MNMNPELENNGLNDFYVDVIFKCCFAGATSIPFFASVVTQLGDLFRHKPDHEYYHRHCYEHGGSRAVTSSYKEDSEESVS